MQTVPLCSGKPEKNDLVFETLELDNDCLYSADAWKVPTGPNRPPAVRWAAAQGDAAADSRVYKEQAKFCAAFRDPWVQPRGARAAWYAGGRYEADAPQAPESEEEGVQAPRQLPSTEEVALWAQDWEESSDDERLLVAAAEMQKYSKVFEAGAYLRVGQELRRDRSIFEREKAEVLSRVILLLQQTLVQRDAVDKKAQSTAPDAEPVSASPKPAAAEEHQALINPGSFGFQCCCCWWVFATEDPIKISRLQVGGKNDWELPPKKSAGMDMALRNIDVSLAPFRWHCRLSRFLCCRLGPCFCRDSGESTVSAKGDVQAEFEVNLSPVFVAAGVQPVTFEKNKLDLRTFSVSTTSSLPCCLCGDREVPSSFYMYREPPCCAFCPFQWTCSPCTMVYNCAFCCCSPCIKSNIESAVGQIQTQLSPVPLAQMHMT
ncbi:hypothetical protein DIPPA_55965 [Diplonema papillatum]|nr:hypothetical protein DIPPA_55965 [Diplonema papillatum]